jgi:hypothetical protein
MNDIVSTISFCSPICPFAHRLLVREMNYGGVIK